MPLLQAKPSVKSANQHNSAQVANRFEPQTPRIRHEKAPDPQMQADLTLCGGPGHCRDAEMTETSPARVARELWWTGLPDCAAALRDLAAPSAGLGAALLDELLEALEVALICRSRRRRVTDLLDGALGLSLHLERDRGSGRRRWVGT